MVTTVQIFLASDKIVNTLCTIHFNIVLLLYGVTNLGVTYYAPETSPFLTSSIFVLIAGGYGLASKQRAVLEFGFVTTCLVLGYDASLICTNMSGPVLWTIALIFRALLLLIHLLNIMLTSVRVNSMRYAKECLVNMIPLAALFSLALGAFFNVYDSLLLQGSPYFDENVVFMVVYCALVAVYLSQPAEMMGISLTLSVPFLIAFVARVLAWIYLIVVFFVRPDRDGHHDSSHHHGGSSHSSTPTTFHPSFEPTSSGKITLLVFMAILLVTALAMLVFAGIQTLRRSKYGLVGTFNPFGAGLHIPTAVALLLNLVYLVAAAGFFSRMPVGSVAFVPVPGWFTVGYLIASYCLASRRRSDSEAWSYGRFVLSIGYGTAYSLGSALPLLLTGFVLYSGVARSSYEDLVPHAVDLQFVWIAALLVTILAIVQAMFLFSGSKKNTPDPRMAVRILGIIVLLAFLCTLATSLLGAAVSMLIPYGAVLLTVISFPQVGAGALTANVCCALLFCVASQVIVHWQVFKWWSDAHWLLVVSSNIRVGLLMVLLLSFVAVQIYCFVRPSKARLQSGYARLDEEDAEAAEIDRQAEHRLSFESVGENDVEELQLPSTDEVHPL